MLDIEDTALLIIDVQEKLFPKIDESEALKKVILQAIESFQILKIPIIVTEQYPKGLGSTLVSFKEKLQKNTSFLEKSSFSAIKEEAILKSIQTTERKNWVLIGIESHICVQQTAHGLVDQNFGVTVLEDAVGSRNALHKKIAIQEMMKKNVRISCLESLLFELLGHAKHSNFKEISHLLR